MNNVTIIGRLYKDPEVRIGDTTIARFGVAVNRDFKNKEGKYDADFISCIAFGKTAEFIEKYFSKGMKIGLIGKIQTGSYTNKDGNKVYTTDIVAEKIEFIESKNQNQQPKQEERNDVDGFVNVPDNIDEELPFN